MADTAVLIKDVDEAGFEQQVIERSKEVPVVVDFWAEWCGPCRALGPAIERAVTERAGAVELAKVDVDANPGLQVRYRVQGIPAVKAFRDGEVVSEFTGAIPPAQIARFLDDLVPSEAEKLAEAAIAAGDEAGLRRVLELDAHNREAATELGRILVKRGENDEAIALLEPLAAGDFVMDGLIARARLAESAEAPEEAFAAWDAGEHDRALETLQEEIAGTDDAKRRDLLRRLMVGLFAELGPASELATTHRRRLASTLS